MLLAAGALRFAVHLRGAANKPISWSTGGLRGAARGEAGATGGPPRRGLGPIENWAWDKEEAPGFLQGSDLFSLNFVVESRYQLGWQLFQWETDALEKVVVEMEVMRDTETDLGLGKRPELWVVLAHRSGLIDVYWSEVCSCFHSLQHFNYLHYPTPLSPCKLIWIYYFDTLNCKVGAFLLRKDGFQGDSEPRSSQGNWSDAVTQLCSVPGWAVSWLLSPWVQDVHLTGPSGQR